MYSMRVIAVLTIDGIRETRIEGESRFMAGQKGDELEERGLGVWLYDWRCDGRGAGRSHRRGRVFIPWSSCLFIQTVDNSVMASNRALAERSR